MLEKLKNKFKKCDHDYLFIRNIHGDEINHCGGYRSVWKCKKCGKIKYSYEYHLSLNGQLNKIYNDYYKNKYEKWKEEHKDTFENIIIQMKKNASRGMCWADFIIICDSNKDDKLYYEKWFKENDLEITDITEECKEDIQIKPYKFHIRWA